MPLSKHRKKERIEVPTVEPSSKKPAVVYIVVYAIVGLMLLSLLSLFFSQFTTTTQ